MNNVGPFVKFIKDPNIKLFFLSYSTIVMVHLIIHGGLDLIEFSNSQNLCYKYKIFCDLFPAFFLSSFPLALPLTLCAVITTGNYAHCHVSHFTLPYMWYSSCLSLLIAHLRPNLLTELILTFLILSLYAYHSIFLSIRLLEYSLYSVARTIFSLFRV